MASKKSRSEELAEDLARSAGGASGPDGASGHAALPAPDPEVSEKPRRRRYPAEYKLRILTELDACGQPGEIGAVLRREGLYFSLVSTWRRQRDAGSLKALGGRNRGRKPKPVNPLSRRVEELERENEQLERQLTQAQTVIEVQKKLSEILGSPPTDAPKEGST